MSSPADSGKAREGDPLRLLPADFRSIAEGFRRGDTRALARSVSLVEGRVPGSERLMEVLSGGQAKRAVRIGVTGPPGAGKSTLVREVARALLHRDAHVGVLAVDPSSPRSGPCLRRPARGWSP